MSKHRQWLCTTVPSETVNWVDANVEALEQTLVCQVKNASQDGDKFGTLQLRFSSPLTETAIRKRMAIGIDTLQPIDGRLSSSDEQPTKKRKRQKVDASTQTDQPAHADIIEKIKAMKARLIRLEAENQELRDRNDINYIASFLD